MLLSHGAYVALYCELFTGVGEGVVKGIGEGVVKGVDGDEDELLVLLDDELLVEDELVILCCSGQMDEGVNGAELNWLYSPETSAG